MQEVVYVDSIEPYSNPATGKGWTPREEEIIAKIMVDEGLKDTWALTARMQAIHKMRRRKLDDLHGVIRVLRVPPKSPKPVPQAPEKYCANEAASRHRLPNDPSEWITSANSGLTYCGLACCKEAYQPAAAPIRSEGSEDLEISEVPKSDLANVPASPNPSEDELTDKIAKNNPIDINGLEKSKLSVYSPELFSAASTSLEASQAPAPVLTVLQSTEPKRRGRPRRWKDDRERKQFERAKPRVEAPIPIDRSSEPKADQPIRARALRRTALHRSYHVPEYVKLAKIEEQNNECLYCNRKFGSAVTNAGVIENLRPEVDHLHPQAGGGRTNEKNVHYACHICNRLKSDFLFETVDEVKAFLVEEWERKGYKTCPPAVPFTADMDLLIAYFRNGGSRPCSRPAEGLPELRQAA